MYDWKVTTLGDFISLQRGHDLPHHERRSGQIPVIGSGGPTGFHDTAIVRGPGITIGRAANLGIPTLVQENFWPLNTTLYVTNFHGNDIRFTYYLLRALDLTGFNSGSVQPMLNRNYIRNFPLKVPDIGGQRAMAAVLGSLDDKIALNERIVSVALELGDASFTIARRSAARRLTLAELASEKTLAFGDGYRTKRSEHGQPGLPILRVAEVKNGRIKPEFTDFVSESYRSAMGGKVSQVGDVILTSKGTVGRVATITARDPSFVYSPQLCYFRILANSTLSSSYIYFWLRSSDFWQQAETRKSKTDMADYLSLTDIRKLTMPLPTQKSDRLWSAALDILLLQISACHEQNSVLAELRDALLPRLMSGEIRVRDAEKVVEDVT